MLLNKKRLAFNNHMSLYKNINKKLKTGSSNPPSKSTITDKAYANMKAGFPNSKKNKVKKSRTAKSMGY